MQVREKLTRSELREIETLLTSEIDRLERVRDPFHFPDDDSDSYRGLETPVSDYTGTSSPVALLERDGQYHALTEALQRLRAGTYGLCVDCGNSISKDRLLVIPETEHCRGCRRAP